MRHVTRPPTAPAERYPAAIANPYDLLGPVRILRRDLDLAPNDLAVLTALVSFLPRTGQDTPGCITSAMTIVFPSNARLAERANGIDERTLRRCLARLAASGLIRRRNSANGKRFPLRYGGTIRDAFGFDLQPLIDRQEELLARAEERRREAECLRSLRAEALALRAAALNRTDLKPETLSRLATMRNILRRATLTTDMVKDIVTELRALAPKPDPMTARDGQNDRHDESSKIQSTTNVRTRPAPTAPDATRKPRKTRDPAHMDWTDFTHVSAYFPNPPHDAPMLQRIILDLGRLLRITEEKLMRGLRTKGAGRVLLAMDYLLGQAGKIKAPSAYFERMLQSWMAPCPS